MPQLLPIHTSLSASAPVSAGLIEAQWLLEGRLKAWSRNLDAFHALLQQVFGIQPSTNANSAALLASSSDAGQYGGV